MKSVIEIFRHEAEQKEYVFNLMEEKFFLRVASTLLHEFWNSTSDACPVEASVQEKQEKYFEEWVLSSMNEFN